jgi:hypothetical protein
MCEKKPHALPHTVLHWMGVRLCIIQMCWMHTDAQKYMHPLSLFPKPERKTQNVHAPFGTKHTHSCLSLHLLLLTWQSLEDLSLLLFSPRYLQLHLAQAKSVLDSSYEEDAFAQSRCARCGCTRMNPLCWCCLSPPCL